MPSTDNDAQALQLASTAVTAIDVRYRLADAIDKDAMTDARDRAWAAYSMARSRLLADGVMMTDADLDDLDQLSQELGRAADTQAFVGSALKLAGLLGRLALA